MSFVTYYELLGVGPRATPDEIAGTFKKLAGKYHPQRNPGDAAAAALYKQLRVAHSVLTDPEKRRKYDQLLQSRLRPTPARRPRAAEPKAAPAAAARARPAHASPVAARPFRPPSGRSPVPQAQAAAPTPAAARPGHEAKWARVVSRRRVYSAFGRVLGWALSAFIHLVALWITSHWSVPPAHVEESATPVEVDLAEEQIEIPLLETGQPLEEEPIPADPPIEEAEAAEIDAPQAISAAAEWERRKIIGVQTGSAFANRGPSGRAKQIKGGGATRGSENAVDAGLQWLASRQRPDGSWAGDGNKYPWANPGMTGLALLAFLGAGHTHYQKGARYDFRRVVDRGLGYLKRIQDENEGGCIAFLYDGRRIGSYMYCHAIATLAFAEAYAMTKDTRLRDRTWRAVGLICEAQKANAHGGWRYQSNSTDADTSVSGWMVMALRSAKLAGIDVPKEAFDGARGFFAKCTDKEKGITSYMPGMARASMALVAVGLLCNQYLGLDREDPYITLAGKLINSFPPKWVDSENGTVIRNLPATQPGANGYYYWYYANLALHQRRGEPWEQWHTKVRDLLIKLQDKGKDPRLRGSWPANTRWASVGGRVYATALAILCLEVYYRYAPIYRIVVDEVLAAYGRAVNANNRFSRLAKATEPKATPKAVATARERAIEKLKRFLAISRAEPGKPLTVAMKLRRGKATRILVELHRHAGRFDKAIAILHALPEKFPGLIDREVRTRLLADCYRASARQHEQAGRKRQATEAEDEAIDLFYGLVKTSPGKHLDLERWLAQRFFERAEWRRAARLYEARYRRLGKPTTAQDKTTLAQLCRRIMACAVQRGDHEAAALWGRTLEELLGSSLALKRERAKLEAQAGNYKTAREIHESILPRVERFSPDWWQAYLDALRMAHRQGQSRHVVERIDIMKARRPDLGGLRDQFLQLRRQADKAGG